MKKKHKVILVILVLVIVVTSLGVISIKSYLRSIQSNLDQLAKTKIPGVNLSNIPDGIYTGSYKMFPIDVEVKVAVKNHSITEIKLLKHRNGKGAPAEAITGKVVESQTLQVDVISGATYSSKVILKAIENALNQAKN